MKKLMIAAAIVCAAAVSQAATCSWKITGSGTLTVPSEVKNLVDGYQNGTLYVFFTTANASGTATERANLLAALKANPTVTGAAKEFSLNNGALAEASFTLDEQTIGTTYRAYGVIIAESSDGAKYAYFTDSKSGVAIEDGDGTTSLGPNMAATTYKDFKNTTNMSAGWYQIAEAQGVPEPTSGLLLLLGVAGLALRRKQK